MMKTSRFLLFCALALSTANGTYAGDDAEFLGQSVYTTMYTCRTYTAFVNMKNAGDTTWTAASGYRLGSQNPQDNMNWGINRVNHSNVQITPGSMGTFSFTVRAPSTAGTYNFQWRMIRNSTWFGDASTNVAITVISDPASCTTTTTSSTTSTTTTSTTTSTTTTAPSTTTTSTTSTTTTSTTSSTSTTQPACISSPPQDLLAGDNYVDFQTPHDYPGNMQCNSSVYTCPPGYAARVYVRYDTETWYDYFFINDADGNDSAPYCGNSVAYMWLTPPAEMNSVWFSFASDSTVSRWGVDVDMIDCYDPSSVTTTSSTSSSTYATTTTTTSTSTTSTILTDCPTSPDAYLTIGINSVVYKSPRNYQGAIDCYSGSYTCPPEHYAKVHAKYDITAGHDLFSVSDPSTLEDATYTGNSSDYLWLEQGYGSVRFRLTSDGAESSWGVDVDVVECYQNTTTTTSSSTTTSLSGPCIMLGNSPPCDVVTLDEIVAAIIQWADGNYALGDVVDLINSWGDPQGYPPR